MMPKMVLLITPKLQSGREIGDAWEKAGAVGVTFLEGYGLRSIKETTSSTQLLPGMMSMFEILRSQDQSNLTLLSVVDEEIIDEMIDAAEAVLGDLKEPNNGVLFVIDVERALGLRSP